LCGKKVEPFCLFLLICTSKREIWNKIKMKYNMCLHTYRKICIYSLCKDLVESITVANGRIHIYVISHTNFFLTSTYQMNRRLKLPQDHHKILMVSMFYRPVDGVQGCLNLPLVQVLRWQQFYLEPDGWWLENQVMTSFSSAKVHRIRSSNMCPNQDWCSFGRVVWKESRTILPLPSQVCLNSSKTLSTWKKWFLLISWLNAIYLPDEQKVCISKKSSQDLDCVNLNCCGCSSATRGVSTNKADSAAWEN